ncbi:type II toxin-antitoxin system VapC family toxin [Anatilimnocola floriformis]|uniref:type II toxin-antitoxin system VapC family toxin n=1 Tax=Anatilimnocola floriformis TaxID=2948575 RepID=UPI0020C319A8|nr:type II toxin-antitoxin system VapC family toxin [Anatilimnocola floriformis]
MKFVLDASVALKWELPENDSAEALQVRAAFEVDSIEFIAPNVFPIEIGHALSRAMRRNLIDATQAEQALERMLSKMPVLFDSMGLIERAFQISLEARIGVYDCLYLALAQDQHCQFLTADARLQPFSSVLLLKNFS